MLILYVSNLKFALTLNQSNIHITLWENNTHWMNY